jgi:transposase
MFERAYRTAVLCVYNFNGSMRKTGAIFKIAPSTICRWNKHIDAKPRNRHGKLSDAMINSVASFMADATRFSALEVVAFVKSLWNVTISRQYAHRIIRQVGFTYKRTRRRGGGHRVRRDIGEFLKRFADTPQASLVSFDESGFDQRMKPVYGYARSGRPAIAHVQPCGDRTRYNLLMAINQQGNSHTKILDHSTKGDDVAEFIRSMPYAAESTILLDNAAIHTTRSVRDACNDKGYKLLFTPPYSPEFNPIEMVFGSIKNDFYRRRYSEKFAETGLRQTVIQCVDRWVTEQPSAPYFRHVADLVAGQRATACQMA